MRTRHRPLLILLFLLVAAGPAAGQQHPNVAKGFQADKLYDFGGIDNVNLYNGNLSLSVPIGHDYGGNGTLKYRLVLSYNSKSWDQQIRTFTTGCLGLPTDDPNCERPYIFTMPSRRSNAGMGWLLSLGRLIDPMDPLVDPGNWSSQDPPWVYESPDGADHAFVDGDLADPANTSYTKDGSFLRLKKRTGGFYDVEFPDGTVHTFLKSADAYSPRLVQIRDRFANQLLVTYATNGDWTLLEYDSANVLVRTHYVRYLDTTAIAGDAPQNVPANYDFAVAEVDLAAFNGQRAVYSFQYTNEVIQYGCGGDWRGVETPNPRVPRLMKVSLPDESTWEFSYYTTSCSSVKKMTLPTKGTTEWTYGVWAMPVKYCRQALVPDVPFEGDDPFRASEGIATKKVTSEAGTAEWTYAQGAELRSGPFFTCVNHDGGDTVIGDKDQQSRVTVLAPDGTKTEHFFSVFPAVRGTGGSMFDESEYGLPFTRNVSVAGGGCSMDDPDALCLSTKFYAPASNPEPKRVTYVRYDGETRLLEPGDEQYRREVENRTVFHDDGGRYIHTKRSEWDGLAQYRTTTTWAGGGTHVPNSCAHTSVWEAGRIEKTNYNPGKPSVTIDPVTWVNSPVHNRPAPTSPWILGMFDERTTSGRDLSGAIQSETTLRSEYDFAPLTGALRRKRDLKNLDGTRSAADVITVFDLDSRGNLEFESVYGGDGQTVSTGALPALTLPSQSAYKVKHGYAFGTRNYSAYLDASGNEFLRVLSAVIDQNTGLASSSKDSSEVQTVYQYDKSGRLTTVTPTGRAATTYTYDRATSTSKAMATESVKAANGSELKRQTYTFDHLGRPVKETSLMPGATAGLPNESRRETTYNAKGQRLKVSELGNATTLPVTVFEYDDYGRLYTIRPPDQSLTTLTYKGAREQSRQTSISTFSPTAADQTITTFEERDALGRLRRVREASGPTTASSPIGGDVCTEYGYDAGDRLVAVTMNVGGSVAQSRVFDYDGRGFLRWESHPESGMTSYTSDARGNVLTKHQSAAGSLFDLEHSYDRAGRPMSILARNPYFNPSAPHPDQPQWRPMKTFTYATDNVETTNPKDLRKGKLLTAARYNYPADDDVYGYRYKVAETYKYEDAAGRKTDRRTKITRGTEVNENYWWVVREIETEVAYDELDLTTMINYPKCIGCAVPAHQTQTFAYDRGRLTAANGFISGISYHANGMWHEVTRTSQMTDTQTVDASGMGRPGSIKAALWNSCTPVSIVTQPVGGSINSSTPAVTLTVTVSGSGPISYQWRNESGAIPGATGSTYLASPSTTTQYRVDITNGCRGVRSDVALVSVNECTPPPNGADNERNPDGTYTLRASIAATQPVSYTWRRASDNAIVGNKREIIIPAPSVNTTYTVTMSNACSSSAVTSSTTVVLPLSMTTNGVQATWNSGNQISVIWPASTGAAEYRVQRRSGAAWSQVATTSALSYTDPNVILGRTYAYRVQATDSTGTIVSPFSNADVATTMNFAQVTAGMVVSAATFDPMLAAVNSVRQAVGWPVVTWREVLSAADPSPLPAASILASHILTCRARMNEALHALGVPVNGYADADLRNAVIGVAHVNDVTARAR